MRRVAAELTARWTRRAASVAVTGPGASLTYRELDRVTCGIERSLLGAGVGPGDRVACHAEDPLEMLVAVFGTWRCDASAVLMPSDVHGEQIDCLHALAPWRLRCGDGGSVHVRTEGERVEAPVEEAAVFFTSGTTGPRKAVAQTDRRLIATCRALEQAHRAFFNLRSLTALGAVLRTVSMYGPRLARIARRQTWYTPLDIASISGFTFALNALWGGHRLLLARARTPRTVLQLIGDERVSVLAMTPAQAELLCRAARKGPPPSSLVVVGIGGAPFDPGLARELEQALGCPVVTGYGSTETGGGITATLPHQRAALMRGSAGYPMPGVELRCVDDDGRDVATSTDGRVLCSLDAIGTDDASRGTRHWIDTGDIGRIEPDGSLTVLGRSDDQILVADRRVSPAVIESELRALPEVADAAVVAAPGPTGREELWAYVVRSQDATNDWGTARVELQALLGTTVPRWLIPAHFRALEELPRTSSGEVARSLIRSMAAREH